MTINLLTAISRKSITNDEIVHIPAGYFHLVDGNFQVNNEHPPLAKVWAALPLLFIQPNEPPAESHDSIESIQGFYASFWTVNRVSFEAISFWSRAMMLAFAVALGWLVFLHARRLFGERAAVLAVALYVLEPTMLAHGRIVHTDVPAAFFYLLFFFTLHHYVDKPSLRRAMLLGVVGGCALTTKFSMLVLLPVLVCLCLFGIVFASRWRWSRARLALHFAATALVMLFVINAAYYFRSPPLAAIETLWIRSSFPLIADESSSALHFLSNFVPTYYLFGILNIINHNRHGHAAFLLGDHSATGWWSYFPIAFALKTTIPFLSLSLVSLAWALRRLLARGDKYFLALVLPLAIYLLLSMSSRINIGIRHLLPVFPFLFILGGATLDRLLRPQRMRTVAVASVVTLMGWMSIEAMRAYPHYVPYMNQLTWRHSGWSYLSDSNVEWGDDVQELAGYLRARGETRVRAALSAGWSTLPQYDVENVNLLSADAERLPHTRYVAIGASFLNGSTVPMREDTGGEHYYDRFARYRGRTPEAVIGHSIYLYREE